MATARAGTASAEDRQTTDVAPAGAALRAALPRASAPALPRWKAMVLSQDPRGDGGAERAAGRLVAALGDAVDFVVVHPSSRTLAGPVLIEKGRAVGLDLEDDRTGGGLDRALRLVRRLGRLRRLFREEDPDIVLSHFSWTWHLLAILAKVLRLTRARIALRFGNPVSLEMDKRPAAYRLLMRLGLRRVDAIIVNSPGMAEDLARTFRLPREEILVIPNAIPSEELLRDADGEIDDPAFAGGIPVVLTAGRLVAQKNHALLIRAFARVRRRMEARLMLLGRGPLEGDLRRLSAELGVADDVTFAGWREHPCRYMRRASAFVLSSEFEGCPNGLLEAMACGCPVVSTEYLGSSGDLLSPEGPAVRVPRGDEAGLAEAIAGILADPARARDLSELARLKARDFAPEVVYRRYLEAFAALAGERCGAARGRRAEAAGR